jgi:trans-2,3-dihydro-3-hydroxyanthranilate isomerase
VSQFVFAIVDVFAETSFGGNPLAVVLDADGLPDEVLRRIAGEFNLSETTFVLTPRQPEATRRLRSFTASGAEVTGAGHNALGAWWWLASTALVPTGALRQELGEAVLDLSVSREGGRLVVAMQQQRATLGSEVPTATLSAPLGLGPNQLEASPSQVVSTGTPHLLVPAQDEAAVDAALPDAPALQRVLAGASAQGCYLYTPDATAGTISAYARFFNPTVGLWEDPATGSAAGPLAWWLSQGVVSSEQRVLVHQGQSLGRPSQIEVIVDGSRVTVRGSAVLTADGELHIHDDKEHP